MLQEITAYICTEGPDYNFVCAYGLREIEHLIAWEKKSAAEFNRTIAGLGTFEYRQKEYTVGPRRYVEHIWERRKEAHELEKRN